MFEIITSDTGNPWYLETVGNIMKYQLL